MDLGLLDKVKHLMIFLLRKNMGVLSFSFSALRVTAGLLQVYSCDNKVSGGGQLPPLAYGFIITP
jgi:hypothetical protein